MVSRIMTMLLFVQAEAAPAQAAAADIMKAEALFMRGTSFGKLINKLDLFSAKVKPSSRILNFL